jgi:hypothetical protein
MGRIAEIVDGCDANWFTPHGEPGENVPLAGITAEQFLFGGLLPEIQQAVSNGKPIVVEKPL